VSFQWPLMLPLLAIVPLTVAAYVVLERRRARYAVRYTNLAVLASVVDEQRAWRRWVPPALFFLALSAALLSLARPQVTVAAHREDANVILTIDSSGSMFAKDVPPTRMGAAQEAVRRFLDKLPDRYRVGVVTFSSEAQVIAPLTRDRQVVRDAVDYLYPGRGTAIGDALARSVDLARGATGTETGAPAPTGETPAVQAPLNDDPDQPVTAILMLSDGSQTEGILQPFEGAQLAKAAGIPVYTVALGTPEGTVTFNRFGFSRTIPVPPDPATLQEIATDTDGEFYAAVSSARLNKVYEGLGSRIGRYRTPREVTDYVAAAAAALLIGAGLLGGLWFPRIP
jgi:Ca-activated chloride channel family protein